MNKESKIVVYSNGDLLNKERCRKVLFSYWELSKAERRAFERLMHRTDLKEMYHKKKR